MGPNPLWDFPSDSVLKNPPANAGDVGSIPGSGRSPRGGNGNPLQYFLPGESHGQRSQRTTVYGVTELDTTV